MDSKLAQLCDAYFRSWMAADPFSATEFGVAGYDAEVPDPSRDADRARMAELARLGAEAARIDPAVLAPDERVSRSMLLRLAADEREELAGRLDELAVTATQAGAQTRILALVPRAPLTDAQRARDYLERCRKLGRYLDGVLARHLEAGREGRFPTARGVAQAVAQLDEYLASDLKADPLLRPEPPGGVDERLGRLRDDPALRFGTAEEILAAAGDALARAELALPEAFLAYDLVPCRVEEIDPVEAKDSVLGYYLPPSADGVRPGTFEVNTYAPATRTRFEYDALSFHESVPGHHLQFALAQRLRGIPEFRRFAYVTSYCEGWALYCERLADELGLYGGDLERLGMVSFDAWRACRLVVDTGMHALGWSRDRAVGFMRDNTALSESNIANEVDRYIAWPGQATAYMSGRLRIRSLRDQARDRLGAAFDLRAFHDAVLSSGPVPLDTLDEIAGGA